MKTLPAVPFALLALLLVGCSVLPEEGPPMKTLHGTLLFREATALPPSAVAHVAVVTTSATTVADPVARATFPAPTGTEIPFRLKIPASTVAGGGEFLVLAQIIDHGKVWYSNLSSPLRISFLADPGPLTIPLRRESLRLDGSGGR